MVDTRTRLAAQVGFAQDGTFIAKMDAELADLTALVLADSTSNETTEWLYLLLVRIGQDYPEWTIKWRVFIDGSPGAYDPLVTIQTGTGARTLTVYNCSVPGMGYNYVDTRYTTVISTIPEPDLTIISYGYNSTTTSYYGQDLHAVEMVTGYWPRTEVFVVAQPPKGVADGDAANHALRSASVRKLAADEGYGLIDAYMAFTDYTGAMSDLIGGDNIHPTAAGHQLWCDEAYKSFKRRRSSVAPSRRIRSTNRVWMGAADFIAMTGSPALAVVNGYPTWAFDAAADEEILGTVDIPSHWNEVVIYLVHFAAATSGDVLWIPRYGSLSTPVGNTSGSPVALTASGGIITVTANAVSNTMRFTKVHDPLAAPTDGGKIRSGRPLLVKITRSAAAGGDTMAGDAQFCGLMFERWS